MKPEHFLRATLILALLTIAGCVPPRPAVNYSALSAESPRSIVIVPVVNDSTQVDAPDNFLVTLAQPLAERGYYVFPINMVKRTMEDDGLADAGMVAHANPVRIASLFGADAVLFAKIERWNTQYLIVVAQTTVQVHYTLKSGKTGATLWDSDVTTIYTPRTSSTGNPLVTIIADVVVAAIQRAHPNYIPLANQANQLAFYDAQTGLLPGPYDGAVVPPPASVQAVSSPAPLPAASPSSPPVTSPIAAESLAPPPPAAPPTPSAQPIIATHKAAVVPPPPPIPTALPPLKPVTSHVAAEPMAPPPPAPSARPINAAPLAVIVQPAPAMSAPVPSPSAPPTDSPIMEYGVISPAMQDMVIPAR